MPVGNLRTAANNDQDDDPRALRPIPIATKDMVSFVEKNNNNAAGQNAEVVRFMFFNGFPQRLDLIVSRTMMMRRAHFFWFCSSLRLSEKGIREREMRVTSSSRVFVFASLSLSRARVVAKKSKRHATKKRRLRVVVSQPLKKKAISSNSRLSRLKRREKKKKRTRANAFCLFYAQFYI